jgi:plastocyanin
MPSKQLLNRLWAVSLMTFATLMILAASFDAPAAQAGPHAVGMSAMSSDMASMPSMQQATADPAALSGLVDVTISGSAFNPAVITVTAGSTVRWTNADPFTHTTTSDIGSLDPWDSGQLGHGGVFTKTFATPGTYSYHCAIHLSMFGTVVVVPLQGPVELSVAGPISGAAALAQTFTASVSPITATQPITYIWAATGQTTVTRTDKGLNDTFVFTWPAPAIGPQMITVTAVNSVGSASATHAITIVAPASTSVADVAIVDFAFSPQIITITAGTTVRWTNTGNFIHTSTSDTGLWDSGDIGSGGVFTRTFDTPGSYAYHCMHHLSMQGTIVVLPALTVTLAGPSIGVHDAAYSFVATVDPPSAALPITFSWEATNQLPVTHVNTVVSDTQVFSWTSSLTGAQWITVTASNATGSVSDTHLIIIDPLKVYLPLVVNSVGP